MASRNLSGTALRSTTKIADVPGCIRIACAVFEVAFYLEISGGTMSCADQATYGAEHRSQRK